MIYLLVFLLLVILWFCYILNKKDYISPSFVFTLSFLFSSIWAMAYANKWDLKLSNKTFFIIIFSIIIFFIVGVLIKQIFLMKKTEYKGENNLYFINTGKMQKVLFIIFGLFAIFINLFSIVKVMKTGWKNLPETIYNYRTITLFTDQQLPLPKIATFSRIALNSAGYWFLYVVINNYLVSKKIDILGCIIVILSLFSDMTLGGRGGTLNILLAGITIYQILNIRKNNKIYKIKFKNMISIFAVLIIGIYAFEGLGNFLGRKQNDKTSNFDYFAKYCGAEIKNLDIYIYDYKYIEKDSDKELQTFINIIRWIGPKIGIKNNYYKLDLPYRSVNGFNLGNVYTMLYPLVYDYGFEGAFLLITLMSIITHICYQLTYYTKIRKTPNVYILIYSYMFNCIVFAFFSNKFYENIFNRQFLYTLIFWYLCKVFFCKIRYVKEI